MNNESDSKIIKGTTWGSLEQSQKSLAELIIRLRESIDKFNCKSSYLSGAMIFLGIIQIIFIIIQILQIRGN
jgi:FMN-dependent NADH-azoreductase